MWIRIKIEMRRVKKIEVDEGGELWRGENKKRNIIKIKEKWDKRIVDRNELDIEVKGNIYEIKEEGEGDGDI